MQALASLLLAAAWMEPLPPPLATLRNPDFDTDPVTAPAPTNWRWYLDAGTGGELFWDAAVGSPTAGSGRVRNYRSGAREDREGRVRGARLEVRPRRARDAGELRHLLLRRSPRLAELRDVGAEARGEVVVHVSRAAGRW